jgi:hypothetical protein
MEGPEKAALIDNDCSQQEELGPASLPKGVEEV